MLGVLCLSATCKYLSVCLFPQTHPGTFSALLWQSCVEFTLTGVNSLTWLVKNLLFYPETAELDFGEPLPSTPLIVVEDPDVKRLAVAISLAVSAAALQGCTSLMASKEEAPEVPTAQAEAISLQGKENIPNRQIQRYVAVRWGNTGRGGAAQLQPGYVHVLLGEDDPQGAHSVSYDTALALREAMEHREAKMAKLRHTQDEARDIRRQQKDTEMEKLMDKLSVDEGAVGLEPGVYATKQPSAETIAASGSRAREEVAEAMKRANENSRVIERERFNQTSEEMNIKMASMTELMEKDRWIMACAGYHDLLDDGDYAYLMSYGGPAAIPDEANPANCPGLYPDDHLADELSDELCPAGEGYSAKRAFYSALFDARGIESSIYNPVTDMLEPCLGK